MSSLTESLDTKTIEELEELTARYSAEIAERREAKRAIRRTITAKKRARCLALAGQSPEAIVAALNDGATLNEMAGQAGLAIREGRYADAGPLVDAIKSAGFIVESHNNRIRVSLPYTPAETL